VNASPCRLPDTAHHSRPRRLARSYLVRLFHSLPSSGFCRRFLDHLFGSHQHQLGNLQAKSQNLALEADSFDAVISRIALMLFPNPVKALTEMRGVVKLGGKVAVIVFSALEKNPYHGVFHGVVRRLGNIPPPAPGEPWMFAIGDPGALQDLYTRAGFLNVSVEARFPSSELLINLRTAKALGLTIPPVVMMRANKVIK
jgi:SAM-dependent methyltransferase